MNRNEPQQERPAEAIDELALQNVLRKRYSKNWPSVMLQLTKRVQAVNQTWAKVMMQVMTIPHLRISYTRQCDVLVITVSVNDEVEYHKIMLEEMQAAQQYIEVLVMDKLDHSELIAKHSQ